MLEIIKKILDDLSISATKDEEIAYNTDKWDTVNDGSYQLGTNLTIYNTVEPIFYRAFDSKAHIEIKIGEALFYKDEDNMVFFDEPQHIATKRCSMILTSDTTWGALTLIGDDFTIVNRSSYKDIKKLIDENNIYFSHPEWYDHPIDKSVNYKMCLTFNTIVEILEEMLPKADIDCDAVHLWMDGYIIGVVTYLGDMPHMPLDASRTNRIFVENWGLNYYWNQKFFDDLKVKYGDHFAIGDWGEMNGIENLYPTFKRVDFEVKFIDKLKEYIDEKDEDDKII